MYLLSSTWFPSRWPLCIAFTLPRPAIPSTSSARTTAPCALRCRALKTVETKSRRLCKCCRAFPSTMYTRWNPVRTCLPTKTSRISATTSKAGICVIWSRNTCDRDSSTRLTGRYFFLLENLSFGFVVRYVLAVRSLVSYQPTEILFCQLNYFFLYFPP